MLFNYKAIDSSGETKSGSIEALNIEVAISALQKRSLVLSSIEPVREPWNIKAKIPFLKSVSNKEVVILSRQIATLFQAQVSALQVFKLLASEIDNPVLAKDIAEVSDSIQGGSSISKALALHPEVFSPFYINMVKAGEESGKLDEIFGLLADYLDRTYEVTSKARNALIYPAFVIATFITVMGMMFTFVIPKISMILKDSGEDLPIYTKIVLAVSQFAVSYGFIIVILAIVAAVFAVRFGRTAAGAYKFDQIRLEIPYIGALYRKLYLSRIADNMQTMIWSGIPMVRAIEITSSVVDSKVFEKILLDAEESVRGGNSFSSALSQSKEIPRIMTQMVKVGEESGEMATILKTLAKFYQREVMNAVDTLIDLIEPVMIVLLGFGVGILLASVLVPIYNLASAIK